ncbi:MAG: hypothetical protein L0241_23555 [Planctomycetia bacterium]|nr:hypothetical protein [Planctomycetia bacterium]
MCSMRRWAVAAVLLFLTHLMLVSATAADEVTVERIAQTWAEREKRVPTCRFRWTQIETHPKGSSLYAIHAARGEAVPTTDLTIHATCTMTLDHEKIRFEYNGQTWSVTDRTLKPFVDVSTFDGTRSASTTLQSTVVDHPEVLIKNASTTPPAMRLPVFLPIWMTVRGSLMKKEIPIEQFQLSGRKLTIKNRLCHELTRKISTNTREQVFVDPGRDNQVTQYRYYHQEKPDMRLDIAYKTDSKLGWIPESWECVVCESTGAIMTSKRCTLTEFVANLEVSASDFEPVCPIGARVVDLTSGKEIHHAILLDGSKGRGIEYVPGSEAVSYDELIAQPPERSQLTKVMVWLVPVVVGVLLLTVGGLVWRAHRREPIPPSG